MIWHPGITVVIGHSNIPKHLQRHNAKKINDNMQFNMRTIEQNGHLTTAMLELNMVPEKFAKYVAIGMGEEVKQNIKSEKVASGSERLIRQRIIHNPLEIIKCPPRISSAKPRDKVQKYTSLQDMFDVLTQNPADLYNMDPGWIRALGDQLYDYIMRSDCTVKQKLEMIDYVKQIHNNDLNV